MYVNRILPVDAGKDKEISLKRRLPKNLYKEDVQYFDLHLHVVIKDISYITSNNSFLFKDGIIYKKGLLAESTLFFAEKVKHSFYAKTFISGVLKFKWRCLLKGKFAIVYNKWSNNYFHWFTEVLPRVILLNSQLPDLIFLFPFELNDQYQIPSLKELGVDFYTKNLHFTYVKNLLVCSPYGNYSGQYIPKHIKEVASFFTLDLVEQQLLPVHKLVYVHRESTKRKIINSEDVINLFEKYNFEVISFDHMSFEDQRKYLANTEVIASIHGAALTNMLFMPNGKKVLELLKENESLDKCYFNLASALDLDYWYLFCEPIDPTASYTTADLKVSIEKLEQVIKSLLISS